MWYFFKAIIYDNIRINATIIIHTKTHKGSTKVGSIEAKTPIKKIKSAILSSFAPNSLSCFKCLAISPSKISLIPPNIYNIQNNNEKGFENDIKSAHTIRIVVIIFGKLFIKSLL